MWQALHAELSPLGSDVVTIALDSDPTLAYPWMDAAASSHVAPIDRGHLTGSLLGLVNVPMAIWVDANGNIVRPAEAAYITPNSLKGKPLPEGLPERINGRLELVQQFPDAHEDYLAAIRDLAANGSQSPFALSPEEVIARSQPVNADAARAGACFELGQHLYTTAATATAESGLNSTGLSAARLNTAGLNTAGLDAATPWWREAHSLGPNNWAYRRQAWSLTTTAPGQPADLIQEPTDRFEGNWLDDLLASGTDTYYAPSPESDQTAKQPGFRIDWRKSSSGTAKTSTRLAKEQ